jgi:3-oxoacyl-[acyl-carrier protein] reductase
VNAAGRSKAPDAPRQTPFNHPSELWEKELHLNYVVLRELTFMALASMHERKYGRVINVTGISEPE